MTRKSNILSLISLVAFLGGAVGTLALMYHIGDPTIVGLFSPVRATQVSSEEHTQSTNPAPTSKPMMTKTATPPTGWQVCTGLKNGHLNVRAKAGSTAPVLGALSEAVSITPTGQSDGDWLEISAPLTGWVHSRFLCGGSP
ncbi:MAG: hypothetical protein CVU44_02370 [Chloroflexi bacterium HGW-Chloroflexi-6]|nr:MAG: hypothetical protein CVU44_02370 [Chloroflexi bacterium HGW-Chloroflexi-6]